jgi:hypothetical protein
MRGITAKVILFSGSQAPAWELVFFLQSSGLLKSQQRPAVLPVAKRSLSSNRRPPAGAWGREENMLRCASAPVGRAPGAPYPSTGGTPVPPVSRTFRSWSLGMSRKGLSGPGRKRHDFLE